MLALKTKSISIIVEEIEQCLNFYFNFYSLLLDNAYS